MSSTARPFDRRRIPAALALITIALAGLLAIPTGLLGGTEAVLMMSVGAGVGLGVVVLGYWIAALAFRGPDRFATKLVVGGFVVRMLLLFAALAALVAGTDLDPSRFVLWLVSFYFVLIMVEAFLLAREGMSTGAKAGPKAGPKEGTAR
jgi:hypothetical protein